MNKITNLEQEPAKDGGCKTVTLQFCNLVFDIWGTSNSVRELNWGDVKLGLYIKIVHL